MSEGFGRSAAEAMACGKAVIATKTGGIPEVVENGVTGKLVPPKNPTALAKVITDLLKDKEKAKEMAQAGRRRVEELFGIKENARRTEKLYEEVSMEKI